jgi:hypothetical protein
VPDQSNTNSWSFAIAATGYAVPEGTSYVSPTVTADRGWLHLEGRYNYESLHTGSLWIGYNFIHSDKAELTFTPMLGGVFGRTSGIAPGYLGTFNYKKIAAFSQGEFVFDTQDKTGSFFYSWSELSYGPTDWFRVGLAFQRTKAYQTPFDVQRGFLVGFSYKELELTTYIFNMGWTDPTVVISLGTKF